MDRSLALFSLPELSGPELANFVPPLATDGGCYRVEVVSIRPLIDHTFAACRDLDDPARRYDLFTPRPLKVGDRGFVRVVGPIRRDPDRSSRGNPARWVFSFEGPRP